MHHKDFVSNLGSNDLIELQRRDTGAGLRHLLGHAAVILGLAAFVWLKLPLWPLAMLPLGIALVFLFTLEHEATHKTPFRAEWLNEAVGHVAGALILQPFLWFRYFHMAHHRFTNIPDKDPELLAGHKPDSKAAYVWHVSGMPYWIGMVKQLVGNALGRDPGDFVPRGARKKVMREAQILVGFYVAAAASIFVSDVLIWIWGVPLLLGMPFLRLYLLAEHGRCAFVSNMFENTRTTYTNRIVRFFAWNMPYHAEHHTLPNVPFHRLPEVHTRMQGHLCETSDGYIAFTSESLRALK
ncbi:fatty acid desaturase [Cognatishimia sp.]|uniref:fatty acid desaturase n=1 Tax=Cognatishimia sp. TaxID=2211648 RepID=UPI003513F44A